MSALKRTGLVVLCAAALLVAALSVRDGDPGGEHADPRELAVYDSVGVRLSLPDVGTPEAGRGPRGLGFGPAPLAASSDPLFRAAQELSDGRFDRAIGLLERALESDSEDPELNAALSAAYLARGLDAQGDSEGARAADLAEALDRIGRDPADLPSLFNRALALEALYCYRMAAQVWESYLERDPDTRWGGVAAESLDVVRRRLEALDPESIENQDVGPAGDPSTTPGLAEIREGRLALRARGPEEALAHFLRARESIPEENLALLGWVEIGIARVEHLEQDLDAAEARALRVLEESAGLGDSRLEGEALWILESLQLGGLSLEMSLSYARARYELGRREDLPDVRASAAFKLSRVLDELGAPEEAWRYRMESLRGYEELGWGEHMAVALGNSAFALARQGRFSAAADLASEVIARDREIGGPDEAVNLVDGLWIRAANRVRAGDSEGALADVIEADGYLERIESPSLQDRYWLNLRTVEGRALQGSNPEHAGEVFTLSLDRLRELGYEYGQAEILLERARSLRSLGRTRDAARDLDSAYRTILRQRERIDTLPLRVSFFDLQTDLADEMVSVAVETGDPESSLRVASSAKGLLFRDPEAASEDLDTSGLQSPLETDELLVAYWVLPDELLIWTRRGERNLALHRRSLRREELSETISRFEEPLRRGAPAEAAAASEAFEALLGPIREEMSGVRRLTIVPDRSTRSVAWAALRDRETGARVLDRFVVNLRTSEPGGRHEPPAGPESALTDGLLAIGDPDVEGTWAPLPEARREVAGLAGQFGTATVLIGEEATRSRFVESLRGVTVVHVAAHFQASNDPWATRIVLASGAEAGEPSDLEGIAAREIATLDLSSLRLAVLSGCATGREGRASLEGTYSMAGAFLAAGADEVVASLWPVDDRMTADLMAELYSRLLAGTETDVALREAQRAISQRNPGRSDWAAFQLISSGGPRGPISD